jgi:DNA-binding transcriptional MerR regulator
MTWSIAEVARMSGVTSRTLRHYDAIGLLPPARTGANGYRYYGQGELLRLQRILLLRELGLGLDEIGAVLAEGGDETAALRRHHVELLRERDRLTLLARTVARTISEREEEEGRMMNPEGWFEGFGNSRYEAEARERWGDAQVDASHRKVAVLTTADKEAVQARFEAVVAQLAGLLDAGVPADDERALDAVDEHYRWVCTFWTPGADAYAGLGQLYVDDERFTEVYERVREGLAVYLADAMTAYALDRLE